MKNIIRMGLLAGALVVSASAHAQNAWTDKITLGGDLRFRINNIKDEAASADPKAYTNTQGRARITASARVNDAMTANFRIATDPGNFNGRSANATFGNPAANTASPHAPIALDLAYGDWRVMPGLVISGGKAPNPFWSAGKNEMVWDADLSFDGVSAKWAADMNNFKPFVNLTYDTIQQLQTAANPQGNANLFGAQIGTTVGIGDMTKGTIAVGYYNFANLTSTSAGVSGGTTQDPRLLDVSAEVGTDAVHNLPLAVYLDWVKNDNAVVSDEGKATLIGLKAGALSNVGSWEAWYNYRDVKAEGVAASFADSEFGPANAVGMGPGVGVKGHQVGVAYMAWDNTTVGLNYWNTKTENTDKNWTRYTADLIWKF